MRKFVFGLATVFTLLALYALQNSARFLFVVAQVTCCNPPPLAPSTPRFPQGAQVTVYIDSSPSGFTTTEQTLIKSGIEDWNDEQNNSGVKYNVVITPSPPPAGTNNTIVVQFSDVFSSGTGGVLLNLHSSSGPGGTSIYAEMIFFNNIRNPQRPESRPEQIRAGARHEIAHGIGLANALDCPAGSTIMNPSWTEETFITSCDNARINEDPVYGGTPAPTPTPTIESGQFDCNDGIDNDGNGLYDCQEAACNHWCIDGCSQAQWQACWDVGAPQCVDGQCYTPILIDTLGDGLKLTSALEGVRFKVVNGRSLQIAWTTAYSDDAWLALDRNSNGLIDGGEELFGNATPQPAPPPGVDKNGFLALAEYDKSANGGNNDGVIDPNDAIFAALLLWQDINHNGFSEPTELHTLSELGLTTLELTYKESRRIDQHGNQFRYRAKITDEHDKQVGRWAWDVLLKMGP